jgi:hypothetical protein
MARISTRIDSSLVQKRLHSNGPLAILGKLPRGAKQYKGYRKQASRQIGKQLLQAVFGGSAKSNVGLQLRVKFDTLGKLLKSSGASGVA